MLEYRPPEGMALLGVAHRSLEGSLGHPDGARRHVYPPQLQRTQGVATTMADALLATQHVAVRNPVVHVRHLDGLEAPVAELVDLLGDRDPLEGLPRLLLDEQAGDPVIRGPDHEHDQRGPDTVGDPHLRAVHDPLVAVPLGPAAQRPGVTTRVRFRQGEGSAERPIAHAWQEPLLLLLGAEPGDHRGADLVGVEDPGQGHEAPRQLLDYPRVGHDVEAQAAVLLRDGRAEEAELAHLVEHGLREGVRQLELGGVRHDVAVHPLPDGADDLVGQRLVRGHGVLLVLWWFSLVRCCPEWARDQTASGRVGVPVLRHW